MLELLDPAFNRRKKKIKNTAGSAGHVMRDDVNRRLIVPDLKNVKQQFLGEERTIANLEMFDIMLQNFEGG
jgi:hypothetical protein